MTPADRRYLRACWVMHRWLEILSAAMVRDALSGVSFSRRSRAAWSQYNACERRMLRRERSGRRDG